MTATTELLCRYEIPDDVFRQMPEAVVIAIKGGRAMKTFAPTESDQEARRPAAATSASQENHTAEWDDSRPEGSAQRTQADTMNQSSQVRAHFGLSQTIDASPHTVAQMKQLRSMFGEAAQRKGGPEEEELQMKADPVVLQGRGIEEDDLLQGKFERSLQAKFATVQRVGEPEEDLLQGKFDSGAGKPLQAKPEAVTNRTGLPDQLKAGIESLSGMDMSDVRVHPNSAKPAQLDALAYAQGNDIHLGPGQEQHLPHEAWHVVQQRQGRVKPTMQAKGTAINDDQGLEQEADVMGARANQAGRQSLSMTEVSGSHAATGGPSLAITQRRRDIAGRKRLNRQVTRAMRLIQAGGPVGNNATQAEVQAHDAAMNPGQHHVMRVVRRSNLIADLQQRKLDHATNNIRDSTALNDPANAGNAGLIAQLARRSMDHA
jgi:hypothetical protein